MATIFNTNQQDNEDQANQTPSTSAATPQIGQQSSVAAPGGQQSGPFSANQNKPGSATNIRSYIDANQTDLAGQVKDTASKNVGAAQDRYATLRDMFGNNQSAINERLNKAQELNQGVNLFGQQQQPVTSEAAPGGPTNVVTNQPQSFTDTSNLTNILDDQQNLDAYSKARDAFTGDIDQLRSDFDTQGYDLSRMASAAGQDVQDFGTEEGRFRLLQDMFGSASPNYSLGQQRLDQALFQGSGDLRQYENELREQYGTLGRDIAGLEEQYNEFIPQVQDRVSALSGEIGSSLRGYEQDLGGALTDRIASRTAADEQMLQDIQNRFENKELTSQDLRFLGFDPLGAGQMIVNDWDTLNQYLDKGQYNLENITTSDDIARYNALRQLAGDQIASEYQLQLPGEAQELDDLYNIRSTDPFAAAYDSYVGAVSLGQQSGISPNYVENLRNRLNHTEIPKELIPGYIEELQSYIDRFKGSLPNSPIVRNPQRMKEALESYLDRYDQRDRASLLGRMAQEYQDPIRNKTEGVDFDALGIDPLNPGNSLNIPGKLGSESTTKTYVK